jgi:hypothetical protein
MWYKPTSTLDGTLVYIGRWNKYIPIESKWHNPYKLKNPNDEIERQKVIHKFKEYLFANSELMSQIHELKDKILG